MLQGLELRDFVIVDALQIPLQRGFTVLTGETGAGKSILIDALQLALGNRADAAVVREGMPRAEVGALFELNAGVSAWLEAQGFAPDDGDGRLLVRRTVDAQGKSRAWINGSSGTVTQLRELAEQLVDIHGQHAWQGLTRPAAVRSLLDNLAGCDAASVGARWDDWRAALAALEAATQRRAELDAERERLAFELRELDRLAPQSGEWDAIEAEQQRLAHGQSLMEATESALTQLDDDGAARSLVRRASQALAAVSRYDPQLASVIEVMSSAEAQLEDASRSLSAYLRHADLDPARLAALDERMAQWLSAARRQRCTPAELPAWMDEARERLRALDAAVDTEALTQAVAAAQRRYGEVAAALSQRRRAFAPLLAERVSAALQTLGMEGARFEIDLAPLAEPARHGLEAVEFRVAGHAGSTPRPLAKVASGGELSRIALAIAVTVHTEGLQQVAGRRQELGEGEGPAAAPANPPEPMTIVFDEVDSGIGGAVADTVGRLLARLGRARQVMAVTHLAQVAACADRHLVVSKGLQGGRTVSRLVEVTGDERIDEIARMLGGDARSAASRAHAAELLARASAGHAPAALVSPIAVVTAVAPVARTAGRRR